MPEWLSLAVLFPAAALVALAVAIVWDMRDR